jgi:hypothetical protein
LIVKSWIAAAETSAAIFDDPHPPTLGAVFGGQFLQLDHAVGDRVNRLVVHVGRQIVEQQDGRAVPREIVLQGQDLPAIAQRALRQQPDFGQAVDHHPFGRVCLDPLEDHSGGLAELQIGRIEQGLLLLFVQQAFRRHQFEDVDARQIPAVRARCAP